METNTPRQGITLEEYAEICLAAAPELKASNVKLWVYRWAREGFFKWEGTHDYPRRISLADVIRLLRLGRLRPSQGEVAQALLAEKFPEETIPRLDWRWKEGQNFALKAVDEALEQHTSTGGRILLEALKATLQQDDQPTIKSFETALDATEREFGAAVSALRQKIKLL